MDAFIVALVICLARAANHDIGVVIDRVHRVADRDLVAKVEDVEDVGTVALGTIRDKDLRGF